MNWIHFTGLKRRQPIPISEFSEMVKKKHFNANIAFEDEFEVYSSYIKLWFILYIYMQTVSLKEAQVYLCGGQAQA